MSVKATSHAGVCSGLSLGNRKLRGRAASSCLRRLRDSCWVRGRIRRWAFDALGCERSSMRSWGKFPDCLLDAVQRQGAPQSWTAEPRRTRRMGFALRRPAAGSARLLCLGERDLIVALTCNPRSVDISWLPRPPLGPREGREWKRAVRECRFMWNELFPGRRPFVGAKVDECFSNATTI